MARARSNLDTGPVSHRQASGHGLVEKPANHLPHWHGADAYCWGILYLPGTHVLTSIRVQAPRPQLI